MNLLTFVLGVMCLALEAGAYQDQDKPLILTPFLKSRVQAARQKSLVNTSLIGNFVQQSHAGYFTVNEKLGHHMFFWFFPARFNPNAPLVLWLNGGPTISSMIGLLIENGPIALDKNATLKNPTYHKRDHSWADSFSMLYVDNPVTIGFSYSDTDYDPKLSTEDYVTKSLFSVLNQFLTLFPEYKTREIYLGGQSYAGKYTISLTHYIHTQVTRKNGIKITGIYLGGPLIDFKRQLLKNIEYKYQIGHLSYADFKSIEKDLKYKFKNAKCLMKKGKVIQQMFGYVTRRNRDNFVTNERTRYRLVSAFMNTNKIKTALRAGINSTHPTPWDTANLFHSFTGDFFTSRINKLGVVLDNYKVLIFSGNLDLISVTPGIEDVLMNTPWSKQAQYNSANRLKFGSKSDGHFTHVGRLCRVFIDGAGHQTPYDKPEVALQVMQNYVNDGCVKPHSKG